MHKVSYALGLGLGQQLLAMGGAELNVDDLAEAIKDVIEGRETKMTGEESQKLVTAFIQEQEEKQKAMQAEKGKAARQQGEAYLADNSTKEGVTTLPSGLQYTVITEGTGRKPKASDTVECHYEGRLIDGTVFDSSYKRGSSATFPLGGVIKGWTEGVQLMSEGSKFRFFIPYNLAYGERGAGAAIPPYAALVFDVELIKVL